MDRQSSAAAAAQANGAGSSLRWYWPAEADRAATTDAATKYQGTASGTTGVMQVVSVGGAIETANVIRLGSSANQFASGVGTGTGRGFTARPMFMTERAGGALVDDVCAFSFRVTMSIPTLGGPLAANKDLGMGFACGSRSGSPANSAQAGVVFGPTDVATVKLRGWRVDGGPLTIDQTVTAFDYSQFHTYEIRGVWGSPSTDPTLQALVDGVPATPKFSWTAAAALLPALNIVVGAPWFTFWFWNVSNGVSPTAFVRSMMLAVANNEAGL